MRVSSKPVSSPGRAENYPPVLMRFLRSNVGSKSRGRCRSSPMFVRRKNVAAARAPAIVDTQEPSSPKVTCMGQVRIRRSKKPDPRPRRIGGAPAERRRRFDWVRNALFCPSLAGKLKAKSFSPDWRKWVSFSRFSLQRKSEKTPNSSKSEPIFKSSVRNDEQESEKEDEEDEQEGDKANRFESLSSTPPKNALLLTRCRSAPYKTSSLASRFWGSPVSAGDQPKDGTEQGRSREEEEEEDNKPSTSKRESQSEESEKIEGLKKETKEESNLDQFQFQSPPRRLILTRSNSEPAMTGERLDPDIGFWKQRRLGYT